MISWETSNPLFALTHLDGRNSHKLAILRPYFSEFGWMKMRLGVMVDYLVTLYEFLEGKKISRELDFSLSDARAVADLERKTNHDLKAIEQFLVLSLQKKKLDHLVPYVNLGIGSEDINSIAFGRLLGECREKVLFPCFQKILSALIALADAEKDTIIVARTHAVAANITTFGKEVANTLLRLCDEIEIFTSHVNDLGDCQPMYETLSGWEEPIGLMKKRSQLPNYAQQYLTYLEKELGLSVHYVSVGADRSAIITS